MGKPAQADVTVVIPTRNRASHAPRAARSALAQRGVEATVVVVDDGSDPASLAELRAALDERVQLVVHERRRGVSAARNSGLERAETDWVAFLDDDDVWAPDKLASQLAALREAPGCAWSCTGCVWVDERGGIVGSAAAPARRLDASHLLVDNVVPGGGSTMVVGAAHLRSLGGFDVSLALYEDWDQWIRLALAGPGVALDRPLCGFKVWQSTTSASVDALEASWRLVADRYAGHGAELGAAADHGRFLAFEAFRRLRAGDHRAASDAYRRWGRPLHAQVVRFAGPLWTRAQIWRMARAVPAAWRHEAEGWLAEALAAPTPVAAVAPRPGRDGGDIAVSRPGPSPAATERAT
ncbi:MAG: glycosyltransferase family 2 protein [Acidimicrobiia bacterium]|nr:glycosyltransferase family 2 protein [Acidimicrobiia bacterium]